MGRRLALIVLAPATAVAVLGCGAGHRADARSKTTTSIPSSGKPKCGYLDVGIGWRVTVAGGISCAAARRIMSTAITRQPCLTHGTCEVEGHRYRCFTGPGDTHESESVFCTRRVGPRRAVAAAISNS